jgi:hypothetical protein
MFLAIVQEFEIDAINLYFVARNFNILDSLVIQNFRAPAV